VRPVLELRSFITSIREIPEGDRIGYNITYTAKRPSRIATVPVGYYEGYDRRLSSVGNMLVQGTPVPVAGRISMNISSIDVTEVPSAKRGDTVVVLSRNREDPNSIEALSQRCGTIPYELLVHIPPHLRRVVE
jgi:alanine racemase